MNYIMLAKKVHKRKVILVSHSMGSQVVFFFMKWVEASGEDYGNGGPTWVEDHIEAFINVGLRFAYAFLLQRD
jgi:phospholipid:diacylglycerol acyltransferase